VDLVQKNETIRVIRHGDEKDCTPRLDRWCRTKIRELAALRPDALIVKSRSPSCALASASVLDGRGTVISRSGTGIFTRRFLEWFPRIPVTEPDRLESPEGRETFWDRVFVFRDFRNTFRRAADRKKILDFHEAYRPVFDMRGRRAMRILDRVAERCATAVSKNGVAVYGGEIARLLERPATPANRVRVCRGLLSRIGSFTAPDELKLARELIEAMRRETVSSRVVFGVLAHLLRNRTEEVPKFRALAERWGFAGSG
jgi:uncharacterized protein YbgA (DUF1722 family)